MTWCSKPLVMLSGGALVATLMASAVPLAAQTALSERPGLWISTQGDPDAASPEILTAPEAAPLIAPVSEAGVVLDATGGPQGVILTHPSLDEPVLERATAQTPRPRPRPATRAPTEPAPEAEPDAAIVVDAAFGGPRPTQRPRDLAELEAKRADAIMPSDTAAPERVAEDAVPAPEYTIAPQTDAAALATELAAILSAEAHDIMATSSRPVPEAVAEDADAPDPVIAPVQRLAPTPTALHAVARMSARNQPAGLSAVMLPGTSAGPRPALQPAAFSVPREDHAPIVSRPLPDGPLAQEEIPPLAVAQASVSPSVVLMPGPPVPPARPGVRAMAPAPRPDVFPYSALPPGTLPEGPVVQARVAARPQSAVPEAMAAVLMTDPPAAPEDLSPLVMPDMPSVDTPPLDPEAEPVLPSPDPDAIARMIADAAICWQFADLSAEAGWASLSIEVALDEMNMPTMQSIRLTGFAHVMSSSAAEAFDAARGALVGCAEATRATPATSSATLVFDRMGVRLR